MYSFNGLGMGIGNISKLSNAVTRSINAENFTGEKGKGGMATEGAGSWAASDLGRGWKVSPCIPLKGKEVRTLAEIAGPGAIQHMWMTCAPELWRRLIIRMYWDGEETPSVEVPLGDFFCNGWCERSIVNSMPVAVLTAGGMNSYWEMPFRKSAKITIENLKDEEIKQFFYQIDYTLTEVPEDVGYFHAQWRRSDPVKYKDVHTIVDGIKGKGHYVGTYLAWQVNNNGWWGEGEVKFYMDGDKEFPTICGTGTEDYFGGAWAFEGEKGKYGPYSSAFLGFHQVTDTDGFSKVNQRFGMYRWHIMDPVRFNDDLKVTVQALGWNTSWKYLPLKDDIASVAYWYQTEPHAPYKTELEYEHLEVV